MALLVRRVGAGGDRLHLAGPRTTRTAASPTARRSAGSRSIGSTLSDIAPEPERTRAHGAAVVALGAVGQDDTHLAQGRVAEGHRGAERRPAARRCARCRSAATAGSARCRRARPASACAACRRCSCGQGEGPGAVGDREAGAGGRPGCRRDPSARRAAPAGSGCRRRWTGWCRGSRSERISSRVSPLERGAVGAVLAHPPAVAEAATGQGERGARRPGVRLDDGRRGATSDVVDDARRVDRGRRRADRRQLAEHLVTGAVGEVEVAVARHARLGDDRARGPPASCPPRCTLAEVAGSQPLSQAFHADQLADRPSARRTTARRRPRCPGRGCRGRRRRRSAC